MKKQLLLILLTLLPMLAWADESGICGDNLTWTYYESTHSLVITGSGDMYDYSSDMGNNVSTAPWIKFCDDMVRVTLPEGLTSIGDRAFLGCSSLASLTLPNSVKSIGERAFYRCSSFISVIIPNSVVSIGIQAFRGCSSLTSVTIPNSLTSIGSSAFRDCI